MKFICIVLTLFCFCTAQANHLMGGEVTYTYVSGNTYQVNVTLYRDCNDCKLGGQGGGSSTHKCSDISEAFLRTISPTCGNKNLSSIALTKVGFENITPICNLSKSACGTGEYAYGVEAHYYTGSINFENFTDYEGCSFQIYIHKPERNEAMTIVNSESDDLYNYAIINPWEENISSPKFIGVPKFIYQVNQQEDAGDYVQSHSTDSIVYQWANPISKYNTPLKYNIGYNAAQFISTYCKDGSSCVANPNAVPAEGLYLNHTTGNYTFTPTTLNEVSTRVMEVEQWRSTTSGMYLASVIRRDVLVIISSESNNNPPKILGNNSYNICVGQLFDQEILVSDDKYNSSQSFDSVEIAVSHDVDNLSALVKTTKIAPYQKIKLNFTPTADQVGTHYIHITATDNYCPNYGKAEKVIAINVKPKPTFQFEIEDKFCGNNSLTFLSNRSVNVDLEIFDTDLVYSVEKIKSGHIYNNPSKIDLKYRITYTDEFGCIDSATKTLKNQGHSIVNKARLRGKKEYCYGTAHLNYLEHNQYNLSNTRWTVANEIFVQDTFSQIANLGQLHFTYDLAFGELSCTISDSTSITILNTPNITLDEVKAQCSNGILELDAFNAKPSGGSWSIGSQELTEQIYFNNLPKNTHKISLTYTIKNQGNECNDAATVDVTIIPAPELLLADQNMCGTNTQYYLRNTIKRPFHFDTENITWRALSQENAYGTLPRPLFDIPNHGTGTYIAEAINTGSNGCTAIDTASIFVQNELVITANSKTQICQSNEVLDLNKYFDISVEGGGWELDNPNIQVNGTEITPQICGPLKMRYVYDGISCFATLDKNIDVICTPNFGIKMIDSLCQNSDAISLSSSWNWTGKGINDKKFDPSTVSIGKSTLTASTQRSGCAFDTLLDISVLEPLNISLKALPQKLCEGETLDISINANEYANISFTNCGNNRSLIWDKNLKYEPTSCDLSRKEILLDVEATSSLNCPAFSNTIQLPYYPTPTLEFETLKGCEPLALNTALKPTNDQNISLTYMLWSDHAQLLGNSMNVNHSNIPTGNYSFEINAVSTTGCKNVQIIENAVKVFPKPKADFSMANEQRLTLANRNLFLQNYSTVTQGELSYNWLMGKQNNFSVFSNQVNPTYKMPADTGKFTIQLVANSDEFCTDTASLNVILVPDIIAFIPNAFTPDHKGPRENSTFRVSSDHAQNFYIQIFNKWGQKVYESSDINKSWDGTYLGKYCQNGVYVYTIELINKAGREYTFQGTVNLIR